LAPDGILLPANFEAYRSLSAVQECRGKHCAEERLKLPPQQWKAMGIKFSPHKSGDGQKSLTINIDPYVSNIALPLAEGAIRAISTDGMKG
jgi:hypothetical protein